MPDVSPHHAPSAGTPDRLRQAMRCVPSPVTVVTAGREAPRAATIGSFTSLSLAPPLVQFSLMQASGLLPLMAPGAPFQVHVLRSDQALLGYHFAVPGLSSEGQFATVAHTRDAQGVPVLDEYLVRFACRVQRCVEAGDHVLVIGLVESVEGPRSGAPLVYLDRAFRHVGAEIEASPTDVATEA